MARPPKLTRFSVENALARTRSVTAAAAYSGVGRRTFQRTMRRLGIVFGAGKDSFDALFEANVAGVTKPGQATEAVAIAAKTVESRGRPEKNALRLSAADFCGSNLGEVRRSLRAAGTMEDRYRRLRGYR